MLLKLLLVITALASSYGSSDCGTAKRLGCFDKLGEDTSEHMNTLLYNGRVDIVWSDYNSSLHRILCKCKKLADESGKKYVMLGLQYYGECWATESGIARVLPMHSNDCFDEIFKRCHSGSTYCAGTDKTTVLYELGSNHHDSKQIDGGFDQWTSWSECSSTCGKGSQERARECNNPKPENGGKDCIGESEAVQECTVKECDQPDVFRNCQSMKKGEEFTTLAAAVDTSFFAPPFCMVPSTGNQGVEATEGALNYDVTVDVFCLTDIYSRVGIFFNTKNEKNYNFAYIHIKSEFFCYTAGVVENGQVSWRTRKEDQCHNTSFQTERWIPLKISVRNGTQVSFYGNNGKITEWKLSGASYGAKGGMIIRNSNKESDQTRIYFKDLKIKIVHQ